MRAWDRVRWIIDAVLFFAAPLPMISWSIFYRVMCLFRLRWYWPFSAVMVGAILFILRPMTVMISGPLYAWYLAFKVFFRPAQKQLAGLVHPMQVHMPGMDPVKFAPSPFNFSRLHFLRLSSFSDYFTGLNITYSTIALMLLFGGLAACIAVVLRPPMIRTSEERQAEQQQAGSGWTDFLIRRAESRERKRREQWRRGE